MADPVQPSAPHKVSQRPPRAGRNGRPQREVAPTTRNALPFHPFAIVLGLIETLVLALGLLGATGGAFGEALAILRDTAVWVTRTTIGGLLLAAEIVIVVLGVPGRRERSLRYSIFSRKRRRRRRAQANSEARMASPTGITTTAGPGSTRSAMPTSVMVPPTTA